MSAPAPAARDRCDRGIDDAAFARLLERLGPFEAQPKLAVAVSGGPDSLALTLLLVTWARARGGSLLALTVDHGLRAGSTDEAAMVGQWVRRLGVAQVVLPWTGDKPASGIQARAREARYRLLEEHCRAAGILHLLLAHHRDDQAETVALRRVRGSGPRGLAGMAAVVERRDLRLLRPLLTVPKAELIQILRRSRHPWIEDPSNRSPAFARTALRRPPQPDLPAIDHRLAARRSAHDRCLADWLARHARVDPLGFIDLDQPAYADAAAELRPDILLRVLLTVGGNVYPPRSTALARLSEALAAGARVATLAGVRLERAGARLRAVRESGAIRCDRQSLGRAVWFDHRFRVTSLCGRSDLAVVALGEQGWRMRRRLAEARPHRPVDRRVGEGLPAIEQAGELVAVPQLGLVRPGALALDDIRVRLEPRHPLAGAPHAAHGGEVAFASPHG
ncbi:MAG TPA: tRNA lysidine(34) synthetase TilS [Geminicoccaceae bacterium]